MVGLCALDRKRRRDSCGRTGIDRGAVGARRSAAATGLHRLDRACLLRCVANAEDCLRGGRQVRESNNTQIDNTGRLNDQSVIRRGFD